MTSRSLVRRSPNFFIAEPRREADRWRILWTDQTNSRGVRKARVAPGGNLAKSFTGVAFAVGCRRKNPSGFGCVTKRGPNVPFVIGKSQLADEAGGLFVFDRPIAEA